MAIKQQIQILKTAIIHIVLMATDQRPQKIVKSVILLSNTLTFRRCFSASEVTTLWRYTNLFIIIIIIIFYTPGSKDTRG